MPSSLAPAPVDSFAAWLATDAGRYVLAWEQQALDAATIDRFGFFALQIGLPEIDLLRANRMPSKICLIEDAADHAHAEHAPTTSAGASALSPVRGSAYELPFASQSIDLVVLPHVLEFADEPHQILREVERVLRAEGQLIVTGFNPLSLWGVRRSFDRESAPPWNSEFISLFRMKDWLKLLNFELARGTFGCYRPAFESQTWLDRFQFMESIGSRWWPIAGGVYMLQAVKRVQGMRLIGPKWKKRRTRIGAVAPAAHSHQPHTHQQTHPPEQQYHP
jgi:SAM-dependent methyltransferase